MTVATAPDTKEVAIELAATILAMQQHVGRALSGQTPHLGDIAGQARMAFGAKLADWLSMAEPVAHRLLALSPVDDADLARRYTGELGEHLNADAASALAHAVDVLTSRGQHPDVAWQRAVAGYGLDEAAMRGYLGTVIAPDAKGVAPLLAANKKMAAKALLAQAEKIGTREAAAWSTLPAIPVSKAYDPQENRDETGRWTAGARGAPKVKTEAGSGGDIVDRLFGDAAPEAPDSTSHYAAVNQSPYGDKSHYAQSHYGGKSHYGGESHYAQSHYAQSPYGAPKDSHYAKPAAVGRSHQIFLLGANLPSAKPAKLKPETVEGNGNIFLPYQNVANYFQDKNFELNRRATVNFSAISDYLVDIHGRTNPIQLSEHGSGWDAAQGFEDVGGDEWSHLVRRATPIWREVYDDPMRIAVQLDPVDLSTISEWAGYPPSTNKQVLLQRISDQQHMRETGAAKISRKNEVDVYAEPGILDAFADYITWMDPTWVGDEGDLFRQELEDALGSDALDDTPIPSVMSFGYGLHEDDHMGDMRGRYTVDSTTYTSAIHEFGYGAPTGKIGLREIYLKPDRV
jgi:hypothetical protein